jgi:membrane-bound lytic murein transglycosylase A
MNVLSATPDAHLRPVAFQQLQGWNDADHGAAYASFVQSCRKITHNRQAFSQRPTYVGKRRDWAAVCAKAMREPKLTDKAARQFFESNFIPLKVSDNDTPAGLFTGYFEPEVAGRLKRTTQYNVPIYKKPRDLIAFNKTQRAISGVDYGRMVDGKPTPYFTRRQIEQGALSGNGLELLWLKSAADAFFMQVQGSGRVRLPDGTVRRIGYAAKSGLPYTPIGAVLIRWGEVAREDMSMQAIRKWMAHNPTRLRELMWHNESFVFFRPVRLADPHLGPLGAQRVQLRALHSLAVDNRYWAYGTPMWLQTRLPAVEDKPAIDFNQLMIAQDTGTAIKGRIRGDIFFGSGTRAALLAGAMQGHGKLHALLPKAVVRRLGIAK